MAYFGDGRAQDALVCSDSRCGGRPTLLRLAEAVVLRPEPAEVLRADSKQPRRLGAQTTRRAGASGGAARGRLSGPFAAG